MTARTRERIEGGLLGLLIGDALGVPYEFNAPGALPPRAEIEFTPPVTFRRSHPSVKPGTWSDDGAQALCLLASLLHLSPLAKHAPVFTAITAALAPATQRGPSTVWSQLTWPRAARVKGGGAGERQRADP